jgi:hypothetical protein
LKLVSHKVVIIGRYGLHGFQRVTVEAADFRPEVFICRVHKSHERLVDGTHCSVLFFPGKVDYRQNHVSIFSERLLQLLDAGREIVTLEKHALTGRLVVVIRILLSLVATG